MENFQDEKGREKWANSTSIAAKQPQQNIIINHASLSRLFHLS